MLMIMIAVIFIIIITSIIIIIIITVNIARARTEIIWRAQWHNSTHSYSEGRTHLHNPSALSPLKALLVFFRK
jgi:hypothetical protein